ncbi:hypothetical protein FS749_016247 [Ceratobasidium sp. UAMH 11750]|nr:hypothetical protein FS749_016247 [Ceratobasidium sp. UAMH 11750]
MHNTTPAPASFYPGSSVSFNSGARVACLAPLPRSPTRFGYTVLAHSLRPH